MLFSLVVFLFFLFRSNVIDYLIFSLWMWRWGNISEL